MEVKKKVNNLIPMMIQNGVIARHRSLFVIVGDYARDQVANLHYMLSQAHGNRARPSVLWCYKSELGFSSNKQKRAEKLKKQMRQGTKTGSSVSEDPFDMFLSSTNITYTYYKETENILGRTFGMLVLQDFQSLTPNIIARTMETVEGGGVVCLLLKSISSLKRLITMNMDFHETYKGTSFESGISGRFNYRFLLSLTTNKSCCVLDDELNILPISSHIYDLQKINSDGTVADKYNSNGTMTSSGRSVIDPDGKLARQQSELGMLKQSLSDTESIGPLVNLTVTLDQAKAYLKCTNVLANNNPNSTVTLFAGRGRGKSATLGFVLAQAIVSSYSNIFITAPSPTNVITVFEFAVKALEALGYKNNIDFDIIEGNLKDFQAAQNALDTSSVLIDNDRQSQKVIVGIVMRSSKPSGQLNDFNLSAAKMNVDESSSVQQHHRQTITFIPPKDNHLLTNCDLLLIDEAAAIPLPYILRLMKGASSVSSTSTSISNPAASNTNNYIVFLSSTVNGYEGTGRALSLQLIKTLREQTTALHYSALSLKNKNLQKSSSRQYLNEFIQNRILEEITLSEPIRYGPNDGVETWMNKLLCLDCAQYIPKLISPPSTKDTTAVSTGLPHPSECTLYYVSRDTLFSCHDMSEHLLQQIMALYVSSHYQNTPNDLQLIADAPQHHLFALLGPQVKGKRVPDILAIAQISLEGNIPRPDEKTVVNNDGSISHVLPAQSQFVSGNDLIPWTISQQYLTNDFAQLTGGRLYRIAVHPDITHLGYGSRLMNLIIEYYDGKICNLDDDDDDQEEDSNSNVSVLAGNVEFNTTTETKNVNKDGLLTEQIALTSRTALPPLFVSLQQRKPEILHWLGVSYGLSPLLHRFFKKFGFYTLNVRLVPNFVTNEYPTIMVRAQTENKTAKLVAMQRGITLSQHWLNNLFNDFRMKFINTLGYAYDDIEAQFITEIISKSKSVYHQSQQSILAQTISEDTAMNHTLVKNKKNNLKNNDMEIYNEKRVQLLQQHQQNEDEHGNGDDDSQFNQQSLNKTGNDVLDTNEFANSTVTRQILYNVFTPFDLKRLDQYGNGSIDYTYILHTLPHLARLFFSYQLTADLTAHQQTLILGAGLQKKQLPVLEKETGIGGTQLLALFNKAIRRLTQALRFVEEREIAHEIAEKRLSSGILDQVAKIDQSKNAQTASSLLEDMDDALGSLKQQKWSNLDEVDKMVNDDDDVENEIKPVAKKQKVTPATKSTNPKVQIGKVKLAAATKAIAVEESVPAKRKLAPKGGRKLL